MYILTLGNIKSFLKGGEARCKHWKDGARKGKKVIKKNLSDLILEKSAHMICERDRININLTVLPQPQSSFV